MVTKRGQGPFKHLVKTVKHHGFTTRLSLQRFKSLSIFLDCNDSNLLDCKFMYSPLRRFKYDQKFDDDGVVWVNVPCVYTYMWLHFLSQFFSRWVSSLQLVFCLHPWGKDYRWRGCWPDLFIYFMALFAFAVSLQARKSS